MRWSASDGEANIDTAIDDNDGSIDFCDVERDQFIELCMDEMESRWECGTMNNSPDYQEIVFDVALENGIWRD